VQLVERGLVGLGLVSRIHQKEGGEAIGEGPNSYYVKRFSAGEGEGGQGPYALSLGHAPSSIALVKF